MLKAKFKLNISVALCLCGKYSTGLAMSAYDGASARFQVQELARSPAINKGAVRIIPASIAGTNAAVTCSNFASLGWTNSEDSVDNNRDSNTTLRWIAETTASNYTDPVGRLDLGYHYKGAVVYVADIVSTFRFNNRPYFYEHNPTDDYLQGINEVLRRAISGKFDTPNLNGTNLVVFPANGIRTTDQYIALGYHIQGTPIVGGIAEYSMETANDLWVDGILIPQMTLKMTDVAAASDGSTTFVALYGSKYFHGYTYDTITTYDSRQEFLQVYRYNEAQYSWSTAVSMIWEYSNSSSTTLHAENLGGLAIASDASRLWLTVSFQDRPDYGDDSIQALGIKTITINHSDLPKLDLSTNDVGWVTIRDRIATEVDMSYDETFTNDDNFNPNHYPTTRLMYYNFHSATQLGDGLLHAGRLELRTSGLTLAGDTSVFSESPKMSGYRIVCNPNDITDKKNQAYGLFLTGNNLSPDLNKLILDASIPSYDSWTTSRAATYVDGPFEITYRANGSDLLSWSSDALHTNRGDLDPGLDNGKKLFIFTNPENRQDIFATWHCDVPGRGVAVCRELLP